ncbi:MAG: cobalt ECF transporter T component CbiQ [Caldisericia bacterium]
MIYSGIIDKLYNRRGWIYKIHPLIKFIYIIIFLILILTTNYLEFQKIFFYLIFTFFLIILGKVSIIKILKKVLGILPFFILISISFLFFKKGTILEISLFKIFFFKIQSNYLNFILILCKSINSLILVIFLIQTTDFNLLIKSLDLILVPKIITSTILFVYRYIFVLVDEIKRMELARNSRYFGGFIINQIVVYANIISVLLIRSINRSERIYFAMVSRGYDGEMKNLDFGNFNKFDFLFLFLFSSILLFIKFLL